jgi:hypothetical protein
MSSCTRTVCAHARYKQLYLIFHHYFHHISTLFPYAHHVMSRGVLAAVAGEIAAAAETALHHLASVDKGFRAPRVIGLFCTSF